MPLIFQTKRDAAADVEIAGVGVLGAGGKGGVAVEQAAQSMPELQRDGKPLTGKALEDAASAFADAHGLTTKSLKNLDAERLRVEAGAFPAGKSIEEISREVAERERAQVEAHAEVEGAAPLVADAVPPQETAIVPEPPGQERI